MPPLASLPGIAKLAYPQSGSILVTLDSTPTQAVTAGVFQSGSNTPLATGNTDGTLIFINVQPSQLQPGSQYVVALSFDQSTWGPATVLVWQQPTFASVDYTGRIIEIGWSLPATTTIAQVQAQLYDSTHQAVIVTAQSSGGGVQLVPPTALDPAVAYTVSITGINGIASGPIVQLPGNLFVATPQVVSALYAPASIGGSYTVTATLSPATIPTGASVFARLLCEGWPVAGQLVNGSAAVIPLSAPLNPLPSWSVDAQYEAGVQSGEPGMPLPLEVPDLPKIVGLQYANGMIFVGLSSAPIAPVTGAVFQGSPSGTSWLASAQSTGSTVIIQIDPSKLQSQFQYTVALCVNATAPSWGEALTLVWQQPSLSAVAYDGAQVYASWTLPTSSTINSVDVQLYDSTHSTIVSQANVRGLTAELLAPSLVAGTNYVLQLIGRNGIATGPAVQSLALITASPTVSQAMYATTSTGIALTATTVSPAPSGATLLAQLVADGIVIASNAGNATSATIALPSLLDSSMRWELRACYQAGSITGPPSVGSRLPLLAPPMKQANYSGSIFSFTWDNAAVEATGAAVKIIRVSDNAVVGHATVPSAQQVSIAPTGGITTSQQYVAALAPIRGSASGIFGASVPLVVSTPTLVAAASSDRSVVVSLIGSSAPKSVLRLLQNGASLATVDAGSGGGFVALPDPAPPGLTISAALIQGVACGPPSSPVPIITATPSVSGMRWNGTAVRGVATATGLGLDTSAINVTLLGDGVPIALPVRAGSGGQFLATAPTNTSNRLTVTASSVGTKGAVQVSGPDSPSFPVLTTSPTIERALLSSQGTKWDLSASWSLPSDQPAGSYEISIAQNGATIETWQQASCDLVASVTTLATNSPASLSVVPIGSASTGPVASGTFLTSTPTVLVSYDGVQVVAQWSAASEGALLPTAFRARLVRSVAGTWTTIFTSESIDGERAVFAVPNELAADQTNTLGVTVDLCIGSAWCETNVVTPLVQTAPIIATATGVIGTPGNFGSCTISWNWAGTTPGALTAYDIVVFAGGGENVIATVTAPASRTTVTFTELLPPGATIAVRAKTANATGPLSAAIPVLLAASAFESVRATNEGVYLAYSDPGATRESFSIAIRSNFSTVALATSTSTNAFVPFASAAATNTYSLAIIPVAGDGRSFGPATSAPAILVAPSITMVTCDSGTVSVALRMSGNVTVAACDVSILRDGIIEEHVASVVPVGNCLTFSARTKADTSSTYSVSVFPMNGVVRGPAGVASAILASPEIGAISVGRASALVTIATGSMVGTNLTFEAAPIVNGVLGTPVTVSQGRANLPLPANQNSSYAVSVRARSASAVGPWSKAVPTPISTLIVRASADADGIALAWLGDSNAQYTAQIVDATGAIVQGAIVTGCNANLPFSGTVGSTYSAQVMQIAGVALGPVTVLPLVTDACPIRVIAMQQGRVLSVQWDAPSAPTLSGFLPILVSAGSTLALASQSPTSRAAILTLPATVPNASSIAIRAVAGTASGPLGQLRPIVFDRPDDVELTYDGAILRGTWTQIGDPRVDGYMYTITPSSGTPITATVSATAFQVPVTVSAQASLGVTVSASAGGALGPSSDVLQAILHAPQILTAEIEGDVGRLTWRSVPDPAASAYRVCASSGPATVSCLVVPATAATFAWPTGADAISISATSADAIGPTTHVKVLSHAPFSVGAQFANTGNCSVGWNPDPAASAYDISVMNGAVSVYSSTVQGSLTTSAAVPSALFAPLGAYSVRVRKRGTDSNTVLIGPWSDPQSVQVQSPTNVRVDCNGGSVVVAWDDMDGATGYRAVLLCNGITIGSPASTALTAASFPMPTDLTKAYTVVVQAITASGSGMPSAPMAIFQPCYMLSQSQTALPHIVPAMTPSSAPFDIRLELPQIFVAAPIGTLPVSAQFVMSTTSSLTLPYALTIPSTSVAWSFVSVARGTLASAYSGLMANLESLAATPIGIRSVQDAISRSMPQTFDETLRYAYGFSPENGYIDLKPGMILRADYEAYQYLGSSAPDSGYINGYTGAAIAEYEVQSYLNDALWLTGFDAFLARVAAAQGVIVPTPDSSGDGLEQGAGGIIDTFFPQFQQPYCRLIYPTDFLPQNSTGSAKPKDNAVLIAGPSLSAIAIATNNLRNGLAVTGVAVLYFRGRASLTAVIRVCVNGAWRTVPIGTTVGNVLASMGTRPPIAGLALNGITLRRAMGMAILDSDVLTDGYDVGSSMRIRFDWRPGTQYNAVSDWLELPLLHGDRLETGTS